MEEQKHLAQVQAMFEANLGALVALGNYITTEQPDGKYVAYLATADSPFAEAVKAQVPGDAWDTGSDGSVYGLLAEQALVDMNLVGQEVIDEVMPELRGEGRFPVALITTEALQIAGIPLGEDEDDDDEGHVHGPDCHHD
ncbi:MAG: hypothetical protein R3F30_13670 [Planctomycetota bacterium]